MMLRVLRGMVVLMLGLLGGSPGATCAEGPARPSWMCVPEDTVFLLRAPNVARFIDAMRTQTKFGAVVFSNERLERFAEVFRSEGQDEIEEVVGQLAKYHLKLEDIPLLFAGEIGTAVVVREHSGGEQILPVVLGWFEPGGDLTDRLMAAAEMALEEQKNDETPIVREDLEIAGQKVMHLKLPDYSLQYDEEKKRHSREVNGYEHVYLARLGNRLVMAMPNPGQPDSKWGNGKPDDIAAAHEQLATLLGGFLTAHSDANAAGGMKALEAPGVADALPPGLVAFEMLFDPLPLWNLKGAETSPTVRSLKTLGLDGAGPMALRFALDGTIYRQAAFFSLPAPRRGLLALVDQPTLPAEPAPWVPASTMTYLHASFDVGKAFELGKKYYLELSGDHAEAQIDAADQQVKQALGVDVVTLLSSLGQQHSLLVFPYKRSEAKPATVAAVSGGSQRMVAVWQIKEEPAWKKLLALAGAFGLAKVDEQGFEGLRFPPQAGMDGGLFVGRGYMVLGVGEDVIEPMLSALRNPPTGDAAMANGPLHRRAKELLPPRAGLGYSLDDGATQIKSARAQYMDLLDQITSMPLPDGDDPTSKTFMAVFEKLKGIIPTEDELTGTMGVSVSQMYVDEKGLTAVGVGEFPAP